MWVWNGATQEHMWELIDEAAAEDVPDYVVGTTAAGRSVGQSYDMLSSVVCGVPPSLRLSSCEMISSANV